MWCYVHITHMYSTVLYHTLMCCMCCVMIYLYIYIPLAVILWEVITALLLILFVDTTRLFHKHIVTYRPLSSPIVTYRHLSSPIVTYRPLSSPIVTYRHLSSPICLPLCVEDSFPPSFSACQHSLCISIVWSLPPFMLDLHKTFIKPP
jgi:hypothetical protein